MKILKTKDSYFNLNAIDAFQFNDRYKNFFIAGYTIKIDSSKYQEFRALLDEFLMNSEVVLDFSIYVVD
jgi:hypothetical protein